MSNSLKNSNKYLKILYSFIFLMFIAGMFLISCKKEAPESAEPGNAAAAAISSDGRQIITVTASGGYSPENIEAKAGVPTILVMKSEGAYGCERSFNIPGLKISKILPENGETEFDLGTQEKGTKLVGVCSMGMYYFQVIFN